MVLRRRPRRKPRRRVIRFRRKPRGNKAIMPMTLRPKTYRFKRDVEETLLLSASSPPEGWVADGNTRIYRNMGYALASIGDVTDFTNLFRQYRINGARVKFLFSNTQSGLTGTAASATYSNSQLLVRMAPNQKGEIQALDTAYWSSIQAKKYKLGVNGGKPIDIYMPLQQRNVVQTSTGTSTTLQKPAFCPIEVQNILFEGLNIAIERVDGQPLSTGSTNNYQYCKMITTLYFEMRGVE